MKFDKYLKSGLIIAATAGFMGSCSNENDAPVINDDDATITVRFLTDEATGTRADATVTDGISQGSMIDVLVYAVYDDKGSLLDFFKVGDGRGVGCPAAFSANKIGVGQNAVGFSSHEYTITLKVNKDKYYQIACWAQNSGCDAYTSTDLSKITVDYKTALNNDERRDAFAGVSEVFAGSTDKDITITMKRPLAQINVGTTGADYEMSAKIPGGTFYTYSEISVKGAATTYNVLNKTATGKMDAPVTFTLNKIPAYWQMNVPTTETDLKNSKDGQEFLKIDLDGDNKILPYKNKYSTIDSKGNYMTETFKYMSMCYVLVPGTSVATKAGETTGSALDEVIISFAGDDKAAETNGVNTSFTLKTVPAMMNYRTNILGGLVWINPKTGKADDPKNPTPDPEDPNDPNYPPTPPYTPDPENPDDVPDDFEIDDPKTLFNSVNVNVTINVEYLGNSNTTDFGENWKPADQPEVKD